MALVSCKVGGSTVGIVLLGFTGLVSQRSYVEPGETAYPSVPRFHQTNTYNNRDFCTKQPLARVLASSWGATE